MTAVDWTGLELAGAFVVGAFLGAIAVVRLTRIVIDHLRDRDTPRD